MARQSAEAQSISFGDIEWPEPLPELPEEEAEVWNKTVRLLAPGWFRETYDLLARYCWHVVRARRISQEIHELERQRPRCERALLRELRAEELAQTVVIGQLATKMRMTQQSTVEKQVVKPKNNAAIWNKKAA